VHRGSEASCPREKPQLGRSPGTTPHGLRCTTCSRRVSMYARCRARRAPPSTPFRRVVAVVWEKPPNDHATTRDRRRDRAGGLQRGSRDPESPPRGPRSVPVGHRRRPAVGCGCPRSCETECGRWPHGRSDDERQLQINTLHHDRHVPARGIPRSSGTAKTGPTKPPRTSSTRSRSATVTSTGSAGATRSTAGPSLTAPTGTVTVAGRWCIRSRSRRTWRI